MPEATQQITKTKFWMVIRYEVGSSTAIRHPTYEAALAEAVRLTKANPNHEFCVLEAMNITSTVANPTVTKKL